MTSGELAAAFNIDEARAKAMRKEAVALLGAGYWERCRDVVLGLVALGEVHPADSLMLALSYRGLGQTEEAEHCLEHARRLHAAFGIPFSEPAFLGAQP